MPSTDGCCIVRCTLQQVPVATLVSSLGETVGELANTIQKAKQHGMHMAQVPTVHILNQQVKKSRFKIPDF
jgi:hypothetical protein